MHEPSLIALEYPKILERLARHTSFSAGREAALALHPSADPEEVRRRQAATSEAVRLIRAGSSLGLGGAHDVRPLVDRAERQGALEAHQFLDILSTLQAAGRLQRALQHLDETFPMLRLLIPDLYPLPALQQAIARCIGPQGEVLDGASPRLGAIRAEIRTLQNRLQERMQSLLQRYRAILQEPIITQRQGRYVLAVRADSKRRLRGLVHDHSASGATLYIEPLEVVEMGNELRELQLAEEEEVRRILQELSEQVAGAGAAIRRTVETLARMDLILARAHFSLELEASEPALVVRREGRYLLLPPTEAAPDASAASPLPPGEPPLSLKQARHPLLNPAAVVPIDVYVGGDFRVLVITGPNTGGKTVALKTVGLLNLMAQAGMHLPAGKGSRIPVVGQVFADIGDEQSIEQSLSTFSAHMTRIIKVLQKAGDDSLVLLDELGAGTDPVEGSALARALIEALLERGCLTLVTTHHSELKAYAYATPGVENACVEFDVETLSPTYVLTIGLPGRSNALAIAGRLGLDPAIIERARRWLRPEELQVESLLQEIQRERDEMHAALEEAAAAREHARYLEKRLEREIHDLERRRHEILAQARAEAEKALEEMRARLEALQREVSRAGLTREELAQARRRLEEAEEVLPEVPPAPPEARVVREEIGMQPLQPGDAVWVESLGTSAEVLSSPDAEGQVELLVGRFKMRRPLEDLRRTGRPETPARSAVHLPAPPPSVPLELEIRGWRVAEAEQALERYLNDAYLAGLPFVRIIHGKGTGTLRRVVREILASHPLVASFEGAAERDGGEGVTIAHLISR
ncbi:MAG: endonuclease MutS2 [Chloroflexia bacterium]